MNTRTKGDFGEGLACSFLEKNGFEVLDRNYLKKWGEIDIVAQKERIMHFFEVKSIIFDGRQSQARHRPEENVHGLKAKRLRRVIETYLEDRGGGLDREFQVHVLCIYIDMIHRNARVKWLKNIIL